MQSHQVKKEYHVIVIGAGAAGMLAAGSAAQLGCRVLLLEKMERPGRKLLITGKGRCNITNAAPVEEFFKHIQPKPRFLKHAFSTFFSDDMISLLASQGVECQLERGGRYFPLSDRAQDVVQALTGWITALGVHVQVGCRVNKLLIEDNHIQGVCAHIDNEEICYAAPSVIIATGGLSYPATGSDGDGLRLARASGHHIIQTRPALVPLETSTQDTAKMQGLALKNVKASVWVNNKKVADDFGEMLFTHFGLSGPIILSLSRIVVDALIQGSTCEVAVDLKPALDDGQLDKRLQRDILEHGRKTMFNLCKLWMPSGMIPVFLDKTGIDAQTPANKISAAERKRIRQLLKNFHFPISGYRPYREAIITAGGVDTNLIQSGTMESKLVKGLYFAGEVIDLDANTGGYNLQIAWSTGWLAGASAAETVNGNREQ